jgi:hypothetical protein
MKFILASLAAGLLFCSPPAAPAAALETVIQNPAGDSAWRDLWPRLARKGYRFCKFEERRYFRFRAAPVILSGELRLGPGLGLSVRYLLPEPRRIIIDDKGILIREDDERGQSAAPDGKTLGPASALLPLMEFNLPQLLQNFELRGRREGEDWSLVLVPRDTEIARRLKEVRMSGQGSRVREIDMDLPGSQRIEILLLSIRENVTFTRADLARYFR